MTPMEIFDSLPPALRRALAYARAPIPPSPAVLQRHLDLGADAHVLERLIAQDDLGRAAARKAVA